MIPQRIRIIVGDTGFEPGTSAPYVWYANNIKWATTSIFCLRRRFPSLLRDFTVYTLHSDSTCPQSFPLWEMPDSNPGQLLQGNIYHIFPIELTAESTHAQICVPVRVAACRLHGVRWSGGPPQADGLQGCRHCCGRLSLQVRTKHGFRFRLRAFWL